jgi:hypothetical protein
MTRLRLPKACARVAVLALMLFVACDEGSTGGGDASRSPIAVSASASPSIATTVDEPEEAPVDDPATEDIEVAGEFLAWGTKDYETTDTSGEVDRYMNGTWKEVITMSDPRLTGRGTIVFNSDQNDRLQLFRWWIYPTIGNDGGTWEGIDTGEIRPDEDHEGWGVYLGTGEYEGLEFHEHAFMGPGATTTDGDAFEDTGVIHEVAVDGWTLDRTFPASRTRRIVEAATEAWSTGDRDAALDSYARDALFVRNWDSVDVGNGDIAEQAASAGDMGYSMDLLPPLFVRGNYAAGAFHWTSREPWSNDPDTVEGWVLAIFRVDEAGKIVRHEVIAANA